MDQAEKPLVIPVFIPHSGCSYQCAFCNQNLLTNQKEKLPDRNAIHRIIRQYFQYKRDRNKVELAFFGGNFLGQTPEVVLHLLDLISPYIQEKKIDGVRFSTRPDTVTNQTLDLIRPYRILAVELGVQSMNDAVLLASKRGHTALDTINAMNLLKDHSYKTGIQMMVGMPQDNETSLLESTKKVLGLSPDFVRIYPLMVLKGSLMEKWYRQEKYHPMELEECIRLTKQMVQIFTAANVDVVRIGLQATEITQDDSVFLAGPWHPAFGHLVYSELLYDAVCDRMDQSPDLQKSKNLILTVHPKSRSRLGGDKNKNINRLKKRYPDSRFFIHLDEEVPMDRVRIRQRDHCDI